MDEGGRVAPAPDLARIGEVAELPVELLVEGSRLPRQRSGGIGGRAGDDVRLVPAPGRKPDMTPPRPTEPIFQIGPNGQVTCNMTVREIVELKVKRRQSEDLN